MSDALASQVAAGEVVERPASVVKELIENSLDAGARELRVEVQRGGVALVKVTDDGSGMSREDALLCLERHATSKLRSKEDLETVRTLGFRGEAIPSIASVSRFRLVTREREAVEGVEIQVDGGVLGEVREAGCSPGTVVEVRELFYNVPARRKFLKSESTEVAHIDHQVRVHALAAPETRVVFRKDGRTVLDVAPSGERRLRIGDLFGKDLVERLVAMDGAERPGMSMSGYLLPPAEARKSRRAQFLFLNGRPVDDRMVFRALEEICRGVLPEGRYPGAWLWLEMDPALVDVNVHPAKREVRFHREHELRALVAEAVGSALRRPKARGVVRRGWEAGRSEAMAPEMAIPSSIPIPNLERGAASQTGEVRPPDVAKASGVDELSGRLGGPRAETGREDLTQSARSEPEPEEPSAPIDPGPAESWSVESQIELPEEEAAVASVAPSFRVVGTVCGEYVVLEAHDGLVLLDPVAARERILYERLLAGAGEGRAESQGLLVPVLLELDARDADVVLRNVDNFAEAGMEVESFGGVTVQLTALPALLAEADPKALLLDLVDELVDGTARTGKRLTFERFARRLAVVGARGEPCRAEAARGLLEALFSCDLPYCAPAGRPTLVQLSLSELARKFGKC